jgi:putative endonuclease
MYTKISKTYRSSLSRAKDWHWYVYIIKCLDGSYYTGMTWNPADRNYQHESGLGSKYTTKHGFGRMVYIEEHSDIEITRKREIQIKSWSRKKKQKLINGSWCGDW